MSQFKSMYTDLLREALACSAAMEKNSNTNTEAYEWRQLNRECRKELYRMHDKVDHLVARQQYEKNGFKSKGAKK